MSEKFDVPLAGPRKRDLPKTLLWPWEVRGLPKALLSVKAEVENRPPVVVIPGLWATDRTMWCLRRYLIKAGYDARGWGLGRNTAGAGWEGELSDLSDGWARHARDRQYNGEGEVPALCDRLGAHIRARSEALGQPIALVGWSLGGYLAREVARDHPDCVTNVITLGAPIVGGPKYTITAWRYRRRGYDIDWIEAQSLARHDTPLTCPVLSIYSKEDAIVGWPASLDRWTPQARHQEVKCSHTAFGFHPESLAHVKRELDRHHGA